MKDEQVTCSPIAYPNPFTGMRTSVIGAARSGIGAAAALKDMGADVLLSDSQSAESLGQERIDQIRRAGVRYALSASSEDSLPAGTELVVTSPGVPKTSD